MNKFIEAEKFAAETIGKSVRDLCHSSVRLYCETSDRDAAAQALVASVVSLLVGDKYMIVPRYLLVELRKQLQELPE